VVAPIVANDFIQVTIDSRAKLVRFARTAQRSDDFEEVVRAFALAITQLKSVDRPRFRLLVDLRASPGRNSPEFENAMAKQRQELLRDFAASAVLVQTAIGKLQVARIGRTDPLEPPVFTDEAAALRWLDSRRSA